MAIALLRNKLNQVVHLTLLGKDDFGRFFEIGTSIPARAEMEWDDSLLGADAKAKIAKKILEVRALPKASAESKPRVEMPKVRVQKPVDAEEMVRLGK